LDGRFPLPLGAGRQAAMGCALDDDQGRVAMFREHPPGWWGWPWRLPRPLSVPELIAAGSLSAELAALLWLAVERRASILVAAGPNGAGKTVTLTALLDFLPPHVARVHLDGMAEDFGFVARTEPASTYLLCNEISDHLPLYLWGRRVRRLFELLSQGFAVGATLHAGSVGETLDFLRAPPLGVPDPLLAQVPLVVTLVMFRDRDETKRRIASLHLLAEQAGRVLPLPLATWDRASDRHVVDPSECAVRLAPRLGIEPDPLGAEVATRARWLEALVADGVTSPDGWRAALRERVVNV
jgi:hypothetical protein